MLMLFAVSVVAQVPDGWKKQTTKEGFSFYTPVKLEREAYDVEDELFQLHGDTYSGSHETGGSKFTFLVESFYIQNGDGSRMTFNEEDGHTILTALANRLATQLEIEVTVDETSAAGGYVLQSFLWADADPDQFRYQGYMELGTGRVYLSMGICTKEGNRDPRVFRAFFDEIEFPDRD